ncbi:hypothetical protein K4749_25115 [Streptomyces sp. TRM72054]|uniref:hypothetical protein n=1 Tax=Streptomyces sp. TRM72054 TaxID=2870562 RepID=UPI001C8CD78E|nr:hypothetical protein [Streptomyces sp. TRM72054]MBX9396777.1 hypothetical protein [Streptomyces sp. TRM72054]
MIGADLVEAITLIAVLPFWRDLAKGFAISELGSDLRADHPDFDAERGAAPDYVPRVPDDDYLPYELLFRSGPA